MQCPNCKKEIFAIKHESTRGYRNNIKDENVYRFDIKECPSCCQIFLEKVSVDFDDWGDDNELIYPFVKQKKLPTEVPRDYQCDLIEAQKIINLSPKASAALSRRLLQKIFHSKLNIKKGNLLQEIDAFISDEKTPSYLADAVDAIRHIGNFAAHPMKYQNSGEIVDVEAGEAEWLLEVLESLLDFVFVQPIKLQKRRDQLNEKLKELGKPELKGG